MTKENLFLLLMMLDIKIIIRETKIIEITIKIVFYLFKIFMSQTLLYLFSIF